MKSLAAAAAVTLMLATSPLAIAQTTTQPDLPGSTIAKDQPATASDSASWYARQAGDMRASKLIGTNVTNAANETVGQINEIVLGKDGKVAAVIIGVGGFLGMGEREVAVNYNALRIVQDTDGKRAVTLNTTKYALKDAPAWTWNADTRVVK